MASDRDKHRLLMLIERLQREGHDETDIVRAVEEAHDESAGGRAQPPLKAAGLGRG